MIEKPEAVFIGIVAQKAILECGGKILFVRSKIGEGKWDLPGGRLHFGEDPIDGLQREVQEEIGCQCEIDGVVSVNQVYHETAQKHCVFITYKGTLANGSKIEIPEDELESFTWLPIEDCTADNVYLNCYEAIFKYQKQKNDNSLF